MTTAGFLKEHRQKRKEASKAAAVEKISTELAAPGDGPFRVIVEIRRWPGETSAAHG